MKKIKPITEGRVKSQVKVYDGEAPKTQAPPPARPPKVCGEWQVNNKNKVTLEPTEKELERERKRFEEKTSFADLWDKSSDIKRTPTYPKLTKTYNMEKRLGKIKNVRFGIGGYQDCQLGVHFELGGDSWGVTDSRSVWDPTRVKCEEYTQWTEEERNKQMNDIMRYVSSLLYEAKVDNVNDLKGKPIECSFDGNILKEWRILTEVL